MSFDHWWVGIYVDEAAYDALKPHFVDAAAKAALSPTSQAAIEAWRLRPADFERARVSTDESAALANDFIWAFNLPGFDKLAEEMLTGNGSLAAYGPQEGFAEMAIVGRNTPVAILWHALGYERASLLPGQMGNTLLQPREVADAIRQTREAYAGTSPDALLDAARRFAEGDADDDELRQVIGFLPDGLAQAQRLGRGFLSLARAQI